MIGMRNRIGLAALILSLVLLPAAEPQSKPQSSDGLYFSNFETPEGRVTVILPADLQAGDTLTGTVWADEAGAPGGGSRLTGYVLEVDGRRIDASASAFTHMVPEGWSKPVRVRLLSPQGRSVGEASLPLARPYPEAPSVGDFKAPSLIQAGQPIQLTGPFSGNLDASRLSVGGTLARPLAQSPRNSWWQVPPEVTGPADVELVQDGTSRSGEARSVGARLAADRLNLQRGETTRMTVTVSGLEGLEQPIPLTLTNESPSVVQLEGGETQTVEIPPAEVGPDGTWQTTRTVTGRVRGSFNLRARVAPGTGWPWVALERPEPPPIPIQQPVAGCACVSVDPAPKANATVKVLSDQEQELRVEVPIKGITCAKGNGDCQAEVSPRAETVGAWRYFDENGQPHQASEYPQSAHIDPRRAYTLTGKCATGSQEVRENPVKDINVGYVVGLKPAAPTNKKLALSGQVKISLSTTCLAPSTVTVRVDTKADSGIQELLSDIDGDMLPGYLDANDARFDRRPGDEDKQDGCVCKAANVELLNQGPKPAEKASASFKTLGSYRVLTLVIPRKAEIECLGRRGSCLSTVQVKGTFWVRDPQTGARVDDLVFLQGLTGVPANTLVGVRPAVDDRVALHGAAGLRLEGECGGAKKAHSDLLTYRAFFLTRSDAAGNETALSFVANAGRLAGNLDLEVTCEGCPGPAQRFKVEGFDVPLDAGQPVSVKVDKQ